MEKQKPKPPDTYTISPEWDQYYLDLEAYYSQRQEKQKPSVPAGTQDSVWSCVFDQDNDLS